ncbi:hypothetical protein CDL15_Pgr007232 [Punica granatum]|uniref:ADP-ribosylation factor GTPase-activating protein AGD5 n=1 Tax=Punica granatum TaxID=22663 RepID=A0A218X9K2_PUNGR|nr:hypothetical protein CDL15_Pgr007232 [Punica granatum]
MKRRKRVVLVRFNNQGGFGFNGGGGGKDDGVTARVVGNLVLAIGLTYLSMTGQLVVDDKFVKESVKFSNEFTAKQRAANDFSPRPKRVIMNEKANVSKEQNDRHRKILEGLLKLPENKECADCKAKYEEKRWVAKDGKSKSPSIVQEEKTSNYVPKSAVTNAHSYTNSSENLFEERKNALQAASTKSTIPAGKVSLPSPPKGPGQVTPVVKPAEPEPSVEPIETPELITDAAPAAASPPKVDFATDLFGMLSMDGPSENVPEAAPTDDWAGFQSAGAASTAEKEKSGSPEAVESTTSQKTSEIEDLFKDTSTATPAPEKPQKDVKNDIMSLFEKSNSVSPFAMHQQQLAMLAQHQSLLMAASAAKSAGGDPKSTAGSQQAISAMHQQQLAMLAQHQSLLMAAASAKSVGGDAKSTTSSQQTASNSTNVAAMNWPNVGYQIPGMTMPVSGQVDLQQLMQGRSMATLNPSGSSMPYPSSGLYTRGQPAAFNGTTGAGASKPQTSSPITSSSSSPTKSGKDYDFSSLTQGMFTKQ